MKTLIAAIALTLAASGAAHAQGNAITEAGVPAVLSMSQNDTGFSTNSGFVATNGAAQIDTYDPRSGGKPAALKGEQSGFSTNGSFGFTSGADKSVNYDLEPASAGVPAVLR